MTTESYGGTPGQQDEAMGVLIIDDNVDTAAMLSVLVESWGYRTCVAHSAKDALARCGDFRPRVVLLDLGLPDEHGYKLALRLRALMRGRELVFVAITGWSSIADQLQSTAAGISHHLVKPLNNQALRAILDGYQALESRRLASQP